MIPFLFFFSFFCWAFVSILANVISVVSVCGIILFQTKLKHFNSVFDTVDVFCSVFVPQFVSAFGIGVFVGVGPIFLLVQFPNGWFMINICIWSSLLDIGYTVNYEIGNITCELTICYSIQTLRWYCYCGIHCIDNLEFGVI